MRCITRKYWIMLENFVKKSTLTEATDSIHECIVFYDILKELNGRLNGINDFTISMDTSNLKI